MAHDPIYGERNFQDETYKISCSEYVRNVTVFKIVFHAGGCVCELLAVSALMEIDESVLHVRTVKLYTALPWRV